MRALYCPGGKGHVQENALRGLVRLSSSLSSLSSSSSSFCEEDGSRGVDAAAESFARRMGRHVDDDSAGEPSVNAITAVIIRMERYSNNLSVQIQGNRLLWNIFDPDDIMDLDYVDILVGKTLKHLKHVMASHRNSQGLHETIGCLLSKMSRFMQIDSREAFLRIAADTMRAYSNSWIVALHGCRCFANVYARSPQTSSPLAPSSSVDGIPEIISSMETFPEHRGVQSEACAALSAICINAPPNKAKVQQLGGIDRIKSAFDLFHPNPNEDICVTTKIRACTALISLAVDPIVLSEIRAKGIITKFIYLLEEDSDIPVKLRIVIQELLQVASDGEDLGRSLILLDTSGEEETCHCIRANLRVITSPDFTPTRIPSVRSSVLRAMRRFPLSASVHQDGCKLLACVFSIAFDDGDSIPQEEILPEVLETIVLSLAEHKNIAATAAAACSALQNFCVMLSQSDSCDSPGLNNLLLKSLSEVVSTIAIYNRDRDNLEQLTGALQAVCAMREGLALSFETDGTIDLLVAAMNASPDSVQLQRQCIGILGQFFFVSQRTIDFLNDGIVAIIMRFIEKEVDKDDAADAIDIAINIILIISDKGYQGVTALLRHERLVDVVVSCMFKYPNSSSVQCAGTDILTNVSLDNYIRADVCHKGGTSRIIYALQQLRDDTQVVSKAFSALANLASGAEVEILLSPDAPAPVIMVNAMTAHPQNLNVQICGAYSLWALSARSDAFKREIVNAGGAEAIAAAMTRFVASKEMQAKGFVVVWSLAVPRDLKVRMGQCAIEPAINGLAAHMSSEKICEEALGCLKCLSTIAANKELLEDNGAIEAIYSCMWLHTHNQIVCKAALAALCNISVNVETNEVVEITAEDLNAIVVVMRANQTSKPVQESAIILLRNFTFSRNNVHMLEQYQCIVPLVQAAMSNFNDHFRGRAEDVLRVLPSIR